MTIRLYELSACDDQRLSPYCWRIRYALAHKGLDFETEGVSFTGIRDIEGGASKTVPILRNGEEVVHESWAIATYLDHAFPDAPPLFETEIDRRYSEFLQNWFMMGPMPVMFKLLVCDIWNSVKECDKDYFRDSREARLGVSLESCLDSRDANIAALRKGVEPLRMMLKDQPFLCGENPGYADYVALGFFLWAAAVASAPLFVADDQTLLAWFEKCSDLHDGLGRASYQMPIFESR